MNNAPSATASADGARVPVGGGRSPVKGDSQDGLLEALEVILSDESSLYLSLGSEEAVVGLNKSPKYHAFGDSMSAERWLFMSPRDRAMWVAAWLRKAAVYSKRPKIRPVPVPPLRYADAS